VGETILAGLVLAICVVLAVRLVLKAPTQRRFDAWMRYAWARTRLAAHRAWHWRSHRREAARAAEEAIQRAARRANGEWDGNVHHGKSFKGPRKPH
jgi:hypothetical protein